jgi:hypothetical protein
MIAVFGCRFPLRRHLTRLDALVLDTYPTLALDIGLCNGATRLIAAMIRNGSDDAGSLIRRAAQYA